MSLLERSSAFIKKLKGNKPVKRIAAKRKQSTAITVLNTLSLKTKKILSNQPSLLLLLLDGSAAK